MANYTLAAELILSQRRGDGWTHEKIGRACGLGTSTVAKLRRRLRRGEITIDAIRASSPRHRRKIVSKAKKIVETGKSVLFAARAIGVSPNVLAGIKAKNPRTGRPRGQVEVTTIYGIFCPVDGLCHYVGQTVDLERRSRIHRSGTDPATGKLISEWSGKGIDVEFRVLAAVLTDTPVRFEKLWVRWMRAQGHPLINRNL